MKLTCMDWDSQLRFSVCISHRIRPDKTIPNWCGNHRKIVTQKRNNRSVCLLQIQQRCNLFWKQQVSVHGSVSPNPPLWHKHLLSFRSMWCRWKIGDLASLYCIHMFLHVWQYLNIALCNWDILYQSCCAEFEGWDLLPLDLQSYISVCQDHMSFGCNDNQLLEQGTS